MTFENEALATRYVIDLYRHLLCREPGAEELAYWTSLAVDQMQSLSIFYLFIESDEYKERNRISSIFPSGHYYSPMVDPRLVRDYVDRERAIAGTALHGIKLSLDSMEAFWKKQRGVIANTPFPLEKKQGYRFFYNNDVFPYGDAISLRAMLHFLKPKRIIEIGSGFSSACMLDSLDEFDIHSQITLIDPYMGRVNDLFFARDFSRVSIIEKNVQDVDVSQFSALSKDDVLFIDSTHVLKTGSDVHYELFNILPQLRSGVYVHFHDIQFPFEYPDKWIFELNHSWNEIYALRAFLMYNNDFSIEFWGSYFATQKSSLIREASEDFLKNSGGSIWIKRN